MLKENIKEALSSILGSKTRSFLTMLGIIIGISAVIIITTIGGSIQSTLAATMNSLGGNMVDVYVSARYPEDESEWATWEYPEMKDSDYVTNDMVEELKETYAGEIKGIAVRNDFGSGKIVDVEDANNYANVSMTGITPEILDMMKLKIIAGRNLTDRDNEGEKRVCVVADTMAYRYFGDDNPIGKTVTVTMDDGTICDFNVIGIYEYNQALFGKVDKTVPERDRYTNVMIPLQTSFNMQGKEQPGYDNFSVVLEPLADVEQATMDITEFFNEKYALNEKFNVEVYNMQSDMDMINTVLNIVTIAVSGIAAISLIVGGVGVMNIMLVSIMERTREIGVRIALGAKRKTIRMQFVIEAIVLCLIGGIIGIILGVGVGALLGVVAEAVIKNMYPDVASLIMLDVHPSIVAILLSLFFSMLTGVFFGYYPADKAAKMEVIDALRYE